jgi:hypothetical protein
MSAFKEPNGKWRVIYRYTDWRGERKQSSKRGFPTKQDALDWEREQVRKSESALDMTFANFLELYSNDIKTRLRLNTWQTKENIINTKLLRFRDSVLVRIAARRTVGSYSIGF